MLTADFELVRDINLQTNAYKDPSEIVQVGSIGYFTATTLETGPALFKTNGTASGTVIVLDPSPGPDTISINELTNVSGVLFFTAQASATGRELWRSNGTAIGTQVVKDIAAGTGGSYPQYLTNVNGTLFFNAIGGNGEQLWKSDGTEAGTVVVKPFSAATGANAPRELANANGTLYFKRQQHNCGARALEKRWHSGRTVLVSDIATGDSPTTNTLKRNSNPASFTNVEVLCIS